MTEAKEPFVFSSRLSLAELTGLKAANLEQLLEHLREVPGSSIFHHTHRLLQQHLHLSPEPPNDFAYWTSNSLGDARLGEALASIDIVGFASIRALREAIIQTIDNHLKTDPQARQRFVPENQVFHFIKCVSFVFPTGKSARNLREMADILSTVSIDSIYFHMFESRLRLERGDNDFSRWISQSVGDEALSKKISRLDPYTCTSESLRGTLVRLIEHKLAQ
ncbi:MAG TPA: DUF5752 family protein [Elusimicrobiales bacterium]|nr:DUF5752 family protein [Elusimicrobiales bacterium]